MFSQTLLKRVEQPEVSAHIFVSPALVLDVSAGSPVRGTGDAGVKRPTEILLRKSKKQMKLDDMNAESVCNLGCSKNDFFF